MKVIAYKLRKIVPPKDDLFAAIRESKLKVKEGDIVAISSKVVSIGEGRTIPVEGNDKDALMKHEADWYFKAPTTSKWRRYFTIAKGAMIGSGGIDESNGDGHFILYPKDSFKSAKRIREWLMKAYGVKNIGVIITDSMSVPLRRGAVGFALAWDNIDPLKDYRGAADIFGRAFKVEVANIIDPLAASAVLLMGEGSEQTPIAVISGANMVGFRNRRKNEDQLLVEPEDDVFAPLIWRKGWKKGGGGK